MPVVTARQFLRLQHLRL